jgi:hypothetical protein
MKKLLTIALSVLFLIAAAGLAGAATPKTGGEKKKDPASKTTGEKKAAAKTAAVKGEITVLDETARTLTVKGKKSELALITDDKTVIKEGKEKKDFTALKTGGKVAVKYAPENGKNLAKIITIRTAKPKAATTKPPKSTQPKDKTKQPPKK